MCDMSPYCPNDNLERRHTICVKHKLNNKDSFSHTAISVTSTMSTKLVTVCYANHILHVY